MPGQCSGGEAQRVALARTLVTQPSTFLLDEPLSSLDAKLRRELRAECDRLHQALKRTFIYVTHDQEEAMTLADRIVVMRAGEIVQVGTPMEIYSDPVNYFVADFFGSPSMNLLAGEIVRTNGIGRFRGAGFELALPDCFRSAQSGVPGSASGRRTSASRSAAMATSRLRSGWSSRSAGIRSFISMPEPNEHSSRSAKASTWPT
jgi:multiple sugar transport system ATP-binding protein